MNELTLWKVYEAFFFENEACLRAVPGLSNFFEINLE